MSVQLPGSWVVDIAYVGNHGVHTPIQYNANAATVYGQGAAGQPEYGPCAACGSPNANVGRTATTTEYFVGYSSNYNALQIKLDHKFARGFSVTNSYTYSQALGFASEASDYPNGLLDYVNQRRNYAPTDFNQTHIFNESFLWHLPVGAGSHLASYRRSRGGARRMATYGRLGDGLRLPLAVHLHLLVLQHSGQYRFSQHQRPVSQACMASQRRPGLTPACFPRRRQGRRRAMSATTYFQARGFSISMPPSSAP